MVRPQPIGEGKVVMGMQLHWPKLLILHTTLFDIIQCFEASNVCLEQHTSIRFESLFLEWKSLAARFQV
ncbi:MAG: hypothetical protein ACM3JG_17330, partial [Thiohalocapsa sp.]